MDQPDALISFSHSASERHQIEALNALDFMPVRFLPVDATRFDVAFRGALTSAFHVWSIASASGFQTSPVRSVDVVTLRLPLRGGMVWRSRQDDFAVGPGQGFLLPFETLFEFKAEADVELLSCTIPQAAISRSIASIDMEPEPCAVRFEPVVELDTLPLRSLSAALRHIFAMAETHRGPDAMMLPLLSEVFVYQLISAWPHAFAQRRATTAAPVPATAIRLARDYIDAHLAKPLFLEESAKSAGVGVRTLQNGFRREFGQTPIQYIIGTRLDRVRDDLRRDPAASVAEIARRWGFTHLSDFSRRFARRFGTTPARSRE